MGKNKIETVALKVAKELFNRGFSLQIYKAYTGSVYIKLDYGVSHSVRISDHDGKKKLKYRFNMIKGRQPNQLTRGMYKRYFYPFTQISNMVEDIVKHREEIISQYSKESYKNFMAKNKRENSEAYGFWTKSTLIESIDDIEIILG